MNRINIIKMLNIEIEWCKSNKSEKYEVFENGFIKGLEQAIYLINELDKAEKTLIFRKDLQNKG